MNLFMGQLQILIDDFLHSVPVFKDLSDDDSFLTTSEMGDEIYKLIN